MLDPAKVFTDKFRRTKNKNADKIKQNKLKSNKDHRRTLKSVAKDFIKDFCFPISA